MPSRGVGALTSLPDHAPIGRQAGQTPPSGLSSAAQRVAARAPREHPKKQAPINREAEVDAIAGHHVNLYANPKDPKQVSAHRAVRDFLSAGVPPGKLVLGVPFYGRAWGEVKAERSGLYQPGKPPREHIETSYASLATNFVDRNGYVRLWDGAAQAPYLWNAERQVFISYEDPESLRAKSRYIREHGLAGVMFWEYHADRSGALLGALAAALRGQEASR
jgi:chitinase